MSSDPKTDSQSKKDEQEDTKDQEKSAKQTPRFTYKYRQQYVPKPLSETEKEMREKNFILDCIALAQISNDYSKANPKLGPAIPPYNSQKDPSVRRYFRYHDIEKILITSKQRIDGDENYLGESIAGKAVDSFHEKGLGHQYMSLRNANGSGHSEEFKSGHRSFMSGVKDIPGFNGDAGYRRNVPTLRQRPSDFGFVASSTSSGWA